MQEAPDQAMLPDGLEQSDGFTRRPDSSPGPSSPDRRAPGLPITIKSNRSFAIEQSLLSYVA